MKHGLPIRSLLAAAAFFLGGTASLFAQAAKPVVPPPKAAAATTVDSEPQTTSASFGDWLMRCQRLPQGSESPRVCEAAQSVVVAGQNGPIAELAIGRVKKTDPLRVSLVLPVNVMFPSAPRISLDGNDAGAVELAWRKCLPGGCFADAVLKDDEIKRWKLVTASASIASKDSYGRSVNIAVSFRGLAQALDAQGREP